MAASEEKQQAARLLKIHRRNLNRLEQRKASLAGSIDLGMENQIDEEKANIAALEPIANPPPAPSPQIQEFVKQTTPGEVDLVMLFMQGTQINQRMAKAEEQNQRIIQEQSLASIGRMQMKEVIDWLVEQVKATEHARRHGATWYRRALLISLSVAVLALIVGCVALVAVRAVGG